MEEGPNLSYVMAIANNDAEFKKHFVHRLKEEFLWEVGMYLRHIKRNEPRSAAEIVTKLKYKIDMLDMKKSYYFTASFEENLRVGDDSEHEQFKNILQKIGVFLKEV